MKKKEQGEEKQEFLKACNNNKHAKNNEFMHMRFDSMHYMHRFWPAEFGRKWSNSYPSG